MAPSSTTVLGKRKPDRPVEMEVRVVFENYWATRTINVAPAATFQELLSSVQVALPIARRHSILGQELVAPKIMLQETSDKILRDRKYTTVRWFCVRGYRDWYERNVIEGNAGMLKAEIHMRTNTGVIIERKAERDEAISGINGWTNTPYVCLDGKPLSGPKEFKWRIAEVEMDDFNGDLAVPNALSTEAWFPARGKVKDAAEKTLELKNEAAEVKGTVEEKSEEFDFVFPGDPEWREPTEEELQKYRLEDSD